MPTLTALTIEASPRCQIGSEGLPFKSYLIIVQDQRDGDAWRFVENRDPGGPREQLLVLDLQRGSGLVTGRLSGPAVIVTSAGRVTVVPEGNVAATVSAKELNGTLSGRLAAWFTDGGTYRSCEADDHRLQLILPSTR
jgi:hypothetical protein